MQSRSVLRTSIVITVSGHCVAQAAYFVIVTFAAGIPFELLLSYLLVAMAVHAAYGAFLVLRSGDFITVPYGRALERVNLANVLTMFRISSVPTIIYLVFLSTDYATVPWLIAITGLSFVSDFADGQISRSRGEITRIGRYLDSSSDYAILAAVAIAFTHFGLVSEWFFWILIGRLSFQFIGMAALFVYQGGHVEPRSSFLGKASVFAAMVVFAVSLLRLIEPLVSMAVPATITAEIIASAIVTVSIGDKAVLLVRDFREARRRKEIRMRESSG